MTPLPRRRPWVLSRQLATLDQLSDGRLIGGIGLGGDGWSEFSAFGEAVDPVVRGQMLDEALELLQRFLTGEPVSVHAVATTSWTAPPLLPRPRQSPLPIWGAVRWPNRRPLARIAKVQGCFPIFASIRRPGAVPDPADIAALRAGLVDLGARSGHRHRGALCSSRAKSSGRCPADRSRGARAVRRDMDPRGLPTPASTPEQRRPAVVRQGTAIGHARPCRAGA